jgi:transposase-like protein
METVQSGLPGTLQQAIVYFSDKDRALQFLVGFRWPDGKPACPWCDSQENSFVSTRSIWKCKGCKKQFSAKAGTIMEDSPIGLDKWLPAIWMLCGCKNGISSYEMHRDLGISQKTAWFMLHRIREAMQDKSSNKLAGEIEIDETFIGGKARNMHKARRARVVTGTGGKDKIAVMGMVERGGNVRLQVVDNRRKHELQKRVREHVEAGSAIFTDELKSYDGLESDFQHLVINHAVEYVNGNVHTNTMENFWSLLKRGLHGTYISVEPFHLARYIDEQAFRYNNRKATDSDRFVAVMKQVAGRRLTFDRLTGKELDSQQG